MIALDLLNIAGKVYAAAMNLVAGQPVTINFYIGKQHLQIQLSELP